jgi:hypothetical protein
MGENGASGSSTAAQGRHLEPTLLPFVRRQRLLLCYAEPLALQLAAQRWETFSIVCLMPFPMG